jgi:hypothetical protein
VYTDYTLGISFRDITLDEIRFFYEPLVDGLIEIQKNRARQEKKDQ